MLKHVVAFAAVFGLVAAPVFAARDGGSSTSKDPARLTDGELDRVVGGDLLLFINVPGPLGGQLEPIRLDVALPANGTAVVQANFLGNASFSATALGRQTVIQVRTPLVPGG